MKNGLLVLCTLCAFVSGPFAQEENKKNSVAPSNIPPQNTTLPPTTQNTTLPPTTLPPTTHNTTLPPTTLAPTTQNTTLPPTTLPPTTHNTTLPPTTLAPTTQNTTLPPTTLPPTTHNTTLPPTTHNTTLPPTTLPPTTQNTTLPPTTLPPTTQNTTLPPTTQNTTLPPTTQNTTLPPTTHKTTLPPTTHKTTMAPTTHKPTLPPTTHKPTLAPTPRPEPTPRANLTVGDYSLPSGKTDLCLKAHVALQIKVSSNKINGTFIVQPSLSKAEGSCQKSTANLTITFKEGFITLLFTKNDTTKNVYVNDVSFKLSYPFKSGDSDVYGARNRSVQLFPAATGHSYSCNSAALDLGRGLSLEVTHVQMQAFNLVNNKDFGMPDTCPADKPDYRVAITVGVVLLVLIVVVVVAYLLGRRRRTQGYQTL